MRNSGVRLVCFDLGGVIVRTCDRWEEACRRAEVPTRPEVEGPEVEARIRAADQPHQLGLLSDDEFYAEVAAATGGLYHAGEVAAIHQAWLLGEYPGMAELVARLNAGGRVRTACLSNTNRAHWTLMQRGAFPAFQALQIRHASHILGVAKPSPAIYRAFEERTGRSGAEILFFDDREDNVDAARAAGWLAVVVNTLAGPAAEIARHLDRLGL